MATDLTSIRNTISSAVYGKDIRTALVSLVDAVSSISGGSSSGSSISIDTSLTQSGYAADAKTVGDIFNQVAEEIDANALNIGKVSTNIVSLTNTVGTLQSSYSTLSSSVTNTNSAVSSRLANVESVNTTQTSDISSLKSSISSINSSISKLQSSDSSQSTSITNLSGTVNGLSSTVNNLSSSYNTVSNSVSANASNISKVAAMVGDSYSTSKSYVIGDVVVYNNVLYRCTAATSGTFNSGKWTKIVAAATDKELSTVGVAADAAATGTQITSVQTTLQSEIGAIQSTVDTVQTTLTSEITARQSAETLLQESVDSLQNSLDVEKANVLAGTEATANYHLGFYLDEDGDLCQIDS